MVPKETLLTHLDYTAWASERLVAAAAQLTPAEAVRDFGTSEKSVIGTLAHVYAADRVWLRRVKGEPPAGFIDDSDRDLAVLQTAWPELLGRWREFLAAADPSARISYHDLKGNPYTTPLWQIVLHVVNHATHHRGQAAGMIRAMGHTPPPLDLIAYYRSLASA
jgi:uncharacterized damage-inducible protein DinB